MVHKNTKENWSMSLSDQKITILHLDKIIKAWISLSNSVLCSAASGMTRGPLDPKCS